MRSVSFRIFVLFAALVVGLLTSNIPKFPLNQPTNLTVQEPYDFFSVKQLTVSDLNPDISSSVELERRQPRCRDEKIRPMLNVLSNDRIFKERARYSDGSADCTDMFDVRHVDLNRDGSDEVLVRGNNIPLCGGVGNCAFWVLGKYEDSYKILLSTSDYADASRMGDQPLIRRTNGYRNLLLKGHITAGATNHTIYKFNGKNYVRGKSVIQTVIGERHGKAIIGFVSETDWDPIAARPIKQLKRN